ncbi:MAG: tetratricopeptide repeat protein [Acidobacteria bacterium]|nr:tetratricopeptide repeat protein [Acidobacteriota bacterium]
MRRPTCALFGVALLLAPVTGLPAAAQTASGPDLEAGDRAEAYRLFMLGRHLEGEGDTDGAIQALRDAAGLDPTSGEPLAELAGLYARAGREDESLAAANEAIERESANVSAHRVLGMNHASAAMSREATREDVDQAITHLEQARDTVVPDLQVELTLGRLYLRAGQNDDAIDLLEALAKDQLGYQPSRLLLSQAYEQAGRGEEALATLEETVATGRPTYQALARLGEMYERRRRWSDASAAYERAAALNPRNASVRQRLAGTLIEADEPARARAVIEDLLEMRPRDALAWRLLAEVELETNNFDAAETAAARLIELEPEGLRGPSVLARVFERRREYQRIVDTLAPVLARALSQEVRPERLVTVFDRLGFAYEMLEDSDGAIRVYEGAIALMPSDVRFLARLAQAYVDADRDRDAQDALRRARVNNPANLSIEMIEADLLARRGDVDAGGQALRAVLEGNPDDVRAHLALASYYSRHDRHGEAIALLEAARERFPSVTSIPFQLGAMFEQTDRFAEAEEMFRVVIEEDPDHAPALNYLGYMLAERGERLNESVELIARALEVDPHNGSYLDSIGWAYFKLDQLDLAEPPLRAAAEQLQRNSVVQDHLGDLMERLGRFEEAIAAWERALNGDRDGVDAGVIQQKIDDVRQR